jgi:hypothetical protein
MLLTLSLTVAGMGFGLWLVGMLRAGATEAPWPTYFEARPSARSTMPSQYDAPRRLPSGFIPRPSA